MASMWISLLALVFLVASQMPSASQGIVSGLSLDKGITIQAAQAAGFHCRPSDDFDGMTRCDKTMPVSASSQTYTTMMIDKSDRTTYLMENADGISVTRDQVLNDIDRISKAVGRKPSKQDQVTLPNNKRIAIYTIWGDVRLEELSFEDMQTLRDGSGLKRGLLVDSIGFVNLSAKNNWPIYRIVGGRGVVYVGSFDAAGRGHRHVLEIDTVPVMTSLYMTKMKGILADDAKLESGDFSLWPRVAIATRELARDTRPEAAAEAQRLVFRDRPARKLYSEVWPHLPGGTIQSLMEHTYRRRIDHYQAKTEFPEIRAGLQRVVSLFPQDHFISFAHYALGDLDAARSNVRDLPIRDIVEYALAYQNIFKIISDADNNAVRERKEKDPEVHSNKNDDGEYYWLNVGEINAYLAGTGKRRLFQVWPELRAPAEAARPHLEAVLTQPDVPHADDAAYFLGWIAYHSGDDVHALEYFSRSMSIGNGDYSFDGGEKQASRLLQVYKPKEQVEILERSKEFTGSTRLWYVAARTAYRDHDYQMAHEIARKGLLRLKIDPEKLPVTTDPDRITEALRTYPQAEQIDHNLGELIYVYFSSQEIFDYTKYFDGKIATRDEYFKREIVRIVKKYSKILDESEEKQIAPAKTEWHKDVKQALYLIETALANTRGRPEFRALREWLHYRRIRIIAADQPDAINSYIDEFERESPHSDLLDDAEAERIFVLAYRQKNPGQAILRLMEMTKRFPESNALDNAYSWTARGFYCTGSIAEGRKLDIVITRKFILTRHAAYAAYRLAQGANVKVSCRVD